MPELTPSDAPNVVPATTKERSEFEDLLRKNFPLAAAPEMSLEDNPDDPQGLKEHAERVRKHDEEIFKAVQGAAQAAIDRTNTAKVGTNVRDFLDALVAGIDKKISAQVNNIIHDPAFTKLEGSWRGLHHLVSNSNTDTDLQIKVMNISKRGLYRELEKTSGEGKFDQGRLFNEIYSKEFGVLGGKPYGTIIGDYEFDHHRQDMLILQEMAKICGSAHAPFIAAASPRMLGMKSWQDLDNRVDFKARFDQPEYATWRSFRERLDASYIGLTLPRFLARAPYSSRHNPVDGFTFEETMAAPGAGSKHLHENFVWSNAAYAMGVNINRAFTENGWCAAICGPENGGAVENLPMHEFPTADGHIDTTCPTEVSIVDMQENNLARLGFIPLSHEKHTDRAVFMGAQSVYKPGNYRDDDARANDNLTARLPYMFACCRFAHYLKRMARDKVGSFMEADGLKGWLHQWIQSYTTDSASSDVQKRKRPLAAAQVDVVPDPSDPGSYLAKFSLRPHYQLDKLDVSLSLVSRLPRNRKA